MSHDSDITIRFSTDAGPVRILAALNGAPPPAGPVMLAEQDGVPVAAVGIADGRTVADRSRAPSGLVTLLRLRRLEARAIVAIWGV
jgi:hypothetical protein